MRQIKTKLLSSVLVLCMLASFFVVSAAEKFVPIRVYGTVTEITDDSVRLQNSNESDPYNDIVLRITEDTILLNAVSGEAESFSSIEKNDSITAYVSPAMTRSLPPQTNAQVIFCEIPQGFSVPTYATVTKVEKKGDTLQVTTDQDLVLSVTDDTQIFPYLTRNIVTKEDIRVDSKIVAWYDAVEETSPATAAAEKILLLESGSQQEQNADPMATLRVYGSVQSIDDNSIILKNSNDSDPYQEIIVHIGTDTLILNAVDGSEEALSSIRTGDNIYADVGPAMTMSIPPQSTARVVFCSIPAGFGVPEYTQVTAIEKGIGSARVLSTIHGDTITVTDDDTIFAYDTEEKLNAADISIGDELVVWSDQIMVISEGTAPSEPTPTPTPDDDSFFTDVPKNHWAYDEILYFYQMGVVAGVGDRTFDPDGELTREQFAKMLAIVFDKTDYKTNTQTFRDVGADRWSYKYIEAVKEYLTGYYPSGAEPFFNPEARAKREDVAYALVKINGLDSGVTVDTDQVLGAFADSNEVSYALRDYMAIAVDRGLIQGDGTSLNPQDAVTRAEAVTLLFRAIKQPVEGGTSQGGSSSGGSGGAIRPGGWWNDNRWDDDRDDRWDDDDDRWDDDWDDRWDDNWKNTGYYAFKAASNTIKNFFDARNGLKGGQISGNVRLNWSEDSNDIEFAARISVTKGNSGKGGEYYVQLDRVTEVDDDEIKGYFTIWMQGDKNGRTVRGEISIDDKELSFEADDDELEFTARNIEFSGKSDSFEKDSFRWRDHFPGKRNR